MSKSHISCNHHVVSFDRTEALVESKYKLSENPLGLNGSYSFKYDYPLSKEAVIVHLLTPEMDSITLLEMAKRDYEAIYAAEDATEGDPGNIPGTLNRASTSGPFGIWGHVISDLYFEGMDIDTDAQTVEFQMGS